MADGRLERLFDDASRRVAAGRHSTEQAPEEGGGRWGLSANLRPSGSAVDVLDGLTAEVLSVCGPGHWATGAARSSHLTVRPLEPFRSAIDRGDPALSRYTAALRQVATGVEPVRLELGGVGLAPNCVLVAARPVDDAADRLTEAFARALGEDDWFQRGVVRDLWYLSLVHFGGPLADGKALVDWVVGRRSLAVGTTTCASAQIIQWRLAAGAVHPEVLAEVRLGGTGQADAAQ